MTFLAELRTTGRLGRAGFLWRHLIVLPVLMAIAVAGGPTIGWLLALVTTVFLVSVWGRRLHDRGRSAWWLLAAAVPVLGPLLLAVDCLFGRSAPGGTPPPDYRVVA